MKFYRVSKRTATESHHGYEFFTSRREADACAAQFKRDWPDTVDDISGIEITHNPEATVETIIVRPNKSGILWALKMYASHPDNG